MSSSESKSNSGDRPKGPRARQAMETRARLLRAAKEVFEAKGFRSSSVAEIVKRAGVSHGTFYHYFNARDDILRVIAEDAEDQLHMRGELAREQSPETDIGLRLREGVRAFLTAYQEQARIMGVVEEVSRYDDQLRASRNARLRRYIDELAESIEALQRHGLADPTLNPTLAAAILGSITIRFPETWLVDGVVDCSFDEAVDNITTVFVNALALPDRGGLPSFDGVRRPTGQERNI